MNCILTRTPAVLLIFCSLPAFAIEWNVDEGDFGVGANWASGNVPASNENATIANDGTSIVSTPIDVGAIRVGSNSSSGILKVIDGGLVADSLNIGAYPQDSKAEANAQLFGRDVSVAVGDDGISIGGEVNERGQLRIGMTSTISTSGNIVAGQNGYGFVSLSDGAVVRSGALTVADGVWGQDGGIFEQEYGDVIFGTGDLRPRPPGVTRPRAGLFLSRGVFQTHGDFVIGDQHAGGFAEIGDAILAATGSSSSNVYIGRGSGGELIKDGSTHLEFEGGQGSLVATGSLIMNPDQNNLHSRLRLTLDDQFDQTFSPISLGGNAEISNGELWITLDESFVPKLNDSWTLIRTGLDLANEFFAIDQYVAAGTQWVDPNTGEETLATYDALTHAQPAESGTVVGEFSYVDTRSALLPRGLAWQVDYTDTTVTLSVVGTPINSGDFNGDGVFDATDLDALTRQILIGEHSKNFELTGDTFVDQRDHDAWVNSIKDIYHGDANMDGEFNSADMVQVFKAAHYENPAADATWSTGDWNGDGKFNSSDFVKAFESGGYELGPKPAATVPEPNTFVALLIASAMLLRCRRREIN